MESLENLLIPIFGIIGVFGMPVFIVLIVSYFEQKKSKAFHATIQELIKSGQELTPELLQSIPGYSANRPKNDIRTGCITSGIGLGVALFGKYGVAENAVLGIGLLVFAIGIGFLAYGLYARLTPDKPQDKPQEGSQI
ncbi:DUF6249 domain-containing protein [Alphaproteobacteria bacterium]|nr:DUF6249 domain-containing protein [Alphaproteobacteria bacterium]